LSCFTISPLEVKAEQIGSLGVKDGDWFLIGVSVSSSDPKWQQEIEQQMIIEWYNITVQFPVTFVRHYENGDEDMRTSEFDTRAWIWFVDGLPAIVPVNLTKGDGVYLPIPYKPAAPWRTFHLNDTIFKSYAGSVREVNCLMTIEEDLVVIEEHELVYAWHLTYYWDKASGVLCEFNHTVTISADSSTVRGTILYKISETNIWQPSIVGVEIDEWMAYNASGTWSSSDPSKQRPQYFRDWEKYWVNNTVKNISGTVVSIESTVHFMNGTNITYIRHVDITTVDVIGSFPLVFVANLEKGDRIFSSEYAPIVNDTIWRTYAGTKREVNYVRTFVWSDVSTSVLDIYWDKITGVLCELLTNTTTIYFTEGYTTTGKLRFEIVETNIWEPEVLNVPYEHQSDAEWCGPACLAMVLRYYGINVHVWDIASDFHGLWGFGLPKWMGTTFTRPLTPRLYDYVHDRYAQFVIKLARYPSFSQQIWEDIRSNITSGYPIILRTYNQLDIHFVVVVGFNSTGLFINDPSGVLLEWLWGRDKVPHSKIHIFINYTVLEKHVATGALGGYDETFLVIQGSPLPLDATLSIHSGSVYLMRKGQPTSYVYLDLDRGLSWKAKNHLLVSDPNDIIRIDCVLYNHKNVEQTLSVRIEITGLWNDFNHYSYLQNVSVKPYNLSFININPGQLNSILNGSQPFIVSMTLLNPEQDTIESFSSPALFYCKSGSTTQLREQQHKLYLHIYDNQRRHVGLNYESNKTEMGIPDSWYYDNLNGSTVIILPADILNYKIVIDAIFSNRTSEFYDLTITNMRDEEISDETVFQSLIKKGETQELTVKISQEGRIILPQQILWWQRYWYMLVALAIILGGISCLFIRRRKQVIAKK